MDERDIGNDWDHLHTVGPAKMSFLYLYYGRNFCTLFAGNLTFFSDELILKIGQDLAKLWPETN